MWCRSFAGHDISLPFGHVIRTLERSRPPNDGLSRGRSAVSLDDEQQVAGYMPHQGLSKEMAVSVMRSTVHALETIGQRTGELSLVKPWSRRGISPTGRSREPRYSQPTLSTFMVVKTGPASSPVCPGYRSSPVALPRSIPGNWYAAAIAPRERIKRRRRFGNGGT